MRTATTPKSTRTTSVTHYWHKGVMRYDGDCTLRAIEFVLGISYAQCKKIVRKYQVKPSDCLTVNSTGAALWDATDQKPVVLGPVSLQGVKVEDFARQGAWVLIVKDGDVAHAIGYKDGALDNSKGYEGRAVIAAFGANVRVKK